MKPRIALTLELACRKGRETSYLDLKYARSVDQAGGIPIHFPPLPSPGLAEEVAALMDGLVLTGGADINPSYYGEGESASLVLSPAQRTDFDLALFRAALRAGKPILAICHGMQIVNVALGGTLIQDIPTQAPGALAHRGEKERGAARHRVRPEPGSRLAEILEGMGEFEVGSIHHQAVKDLAPGLRVSARAPDGLIEGVEIPDRPRIVCVQWHPEEDPESEATRRIFRNLVEAAG